MNNYQAQQQTEQWIREQGMDVAAFNTTPVHLLQAQSVAHTLVHKHSNLLSSTQAKTLTHFLHLMAHKNTREKLKPQAVFPILNIGTKINRQLFALNKHQ
jgi:hypothetical protein